MNFLPEAPGLSLTWRATGHTGSAAHRRVVGALQAVVVNGLKSFQALSWGQEWPGHPLILSLFCLSASGDWVPGPFGALSGLARSEKDVPEVHTDRWIRQLPCLRQQLKPGGNSQLWPATRPRNPSSCLVEEDDGLSKVGGSLRKVAA